MRGISEKRLKEIAADSIKEVRYVVEVLLARECKELNDWKPIDDDTPTNRPILMYCPQADSHHKLAIDKYDDVAEFAYKPTHWTEPPPPKNHD